MKQLKNNVRKIVEHKYFTNIVITVILLNAIMIGLETYPVLYSENESIFHLFEVFFLWFFTIEIAMRMLSEKKLFHFFKSSWNVFDFIIVAGVLLFSGTYFLSAIRILRVFRVLRAITVIPSLQRLVTAFLKTIPSLGTIMILLGLLFYIFAVLGVLFYREISPEYFGSLHLAFITLFQVITLESWASGIFRPIFEASPLSWIYFISFILIGTFIVLNLVVGELLNNIQETREEERKEDKVELTRKELDKLSNEIAELKQLLLQKDVKK
ncbi:ion transporter [Sutcliffiella cohnii]|uniref:ion transporter n=1 Tax=Sutcliffiella cohnii TaxID=33932 RepID=UPI002E1A35DF|nr:ion transporter [Sutcliffiella cohnii]